MKKPGISILYFLVGIIFILLPHNSPFFTELVVKALIIPVLMILFLVNINPLLDRLHRYLFAGLFFSWAGDVILEFSIRNGNLFVMGLVFFLLAHIMYFTVFITTPGKNTISGNRLWLLLPVIIYGIVLVWLLYDDLAEMRVPVILYAIIILTMLSGAITRIGKVNTKSFWLVLAGAILFLISDSAIAVNKFSYPFKGSGIVIMSTYVVAQYLIVAGYINQFRQNEEDCKTN
jgi:uncharacterized membrane protein YhhN